MSVYQENIHQLNGGIKECRRQKRKMRFMLRLDHYVAITITKSQAIEIMTMSSNYWAELGWDDSVEPCTVYTIIRKPE
jgi:hypothetical protein